MKLVDTNIVIYFLDREGHWHDRAKSAFVEPDEQFVLSAITYFEIFHGVPRRERVKTKILLGAFPILEVNQTIAERAAFLMADFRKSRKFKLDVLIASTALVHAIPLITNNPKDFAWIPGLQIETF